MALFRRAKKQRWSIITSAPHGEAGRQWGDYWFAQDLAEALNAEGVLATVYSRAGMKLPDIAGSTDPDHVVLILRGLRQMLPNNPNLTWLLWVISHPELIEPGEASEFKRAFAASAHWNPQADLGSFTPLLQATNPERFHPIAHPRNEGVLFVGSTRGQYRQIVQDAVTQGIPLNLYGVGWSEFVDRSLISGDFLDNGELPQAYANAAFVLNDHHQDMADNGFLSNRLFDAVSAGARVVSDPALGLAEVFGSSVVQYRSPEQLSEIIANPDSFFPVEQLAFDQERIRREHSFAVRARTLIQAANDD
jgi:O-antigen biosynthesis protein